MTTTADITTEATERVVALVAAATDTCAADIMGYYRVAAVARARFIVYHLLREVLRWPLTRIAEGTQRKEHGTIMHGLSRIQTWRQCDTALNELIASLEASVRPIALWCAQQTNQARQQRTSQALGLLAVQNLTEALPHLTRADTITLLDRLTAHLEHTRSLPTAI